MKVSNRNNIAFNGLYLKNISQQDMKKIIKPNLAALKDFAKDNDITLSSGSILEVHKTFTSPRPTIDISITPKENYRTSVANIKQSMIVNYETGKEDLFDLIKTTIRNLF